jgi:hypothetical protein
MPFAFSTFAEVCEIAATGADYGWTAPYGDGVDCVLHRTERFPPGPATCSGTGIHTWSASWAGSFDTLSFLVDYRAVKRIDVSAGVALSNICSGLANGYLAAQNIDPTVGVRIKS